MIELIASDNTVLDLIPGTVLQVNLKNPIFNTEVMEGSFSYAFTIPLTPKNRLFFGLPDQVSSLAGYTVEFEGFRLKYGLIELSCKLSLLKVVNGNLSANVYTASGALADKLKRTKLNEIATQTINVQQEFYYIKSKYSIDPGTPGSLASGTIIWSITGGGTEKYQYAVPLLATNADIVKEFARKINAYRPIPNWSNTETYQYEELVLDPTDDKVYICINDPSTGHPVSDPLWWDFLCNKADWNALRAANGTTYWYEYDEFNALKREKAFAIDEFLIVYDSLNGVGRILDVNTLNDAADTTAAGYFSLYEYAAYDINVYQENFTALAGYMTAKILSDPANPEFTFFPIHNPNFSPDADYCGIVNYWRDGAFRGNIKRELPYQYAFSAQLNLIYTLQKVHEHLGQEVEDNGVFSDDFLETLYLLNNFSNDRNLRGFDAAGFYYIDAGANIINLSKNLPPISLADFINGIRGFFFLGIWFDWFTGKVVYRNLKDLLSDFTNAVDLTEFVASFKELSYTSPDGFNIQYTHDGGDAFISENLRDIFNDDFTIISPVATKAALISGPNENDLCLVKDEDNWYVAVLLFENVIEWQYFCKNLPGAQIGNAKTTYQPKCATPLMYTGHDFARGPKYVPPFFVQSEENTYRLGDEVQDDSENYYRCILEHADEPLSNATYWEPVEKYRWRIPMTAQDRSSRNFKEKSGCTLRLLSYAGIQPNPTGSDPDDVYPFATNDRGALGSLKWGGDYGLIETRGKEWFEFLTNSKKAVASIRMSEVLFQKLKPWLPVKVENQFYLLGEIKVSFPLDATLAELPLYSISYGN
jgi:hypothetical protein